MTTSGDTPRLYRRHQRHARFANLRYSPQEEAFLDTQAARLSLTNKQVFDKLAKNTAQRIKDAPNSGALS